MDFHRTIKTPNFYGVPTYDSNDSFQFSNYIFISSVITLFNTLLLAYQLLIITLIRLACLTGAVVV